MANGGEGAIPAGPVSEAGQVARLYADLRRQAMADRIRWPLWLPAALGAGAALYFALLIEPGGIWTIGIAILALAAALAAIRLETARWRIVLALLAAALLGFAAAKVRTEIVRAPVLERQIGPVRFTARVVESEPRGYGSRMVLEPQSIRRLGAETPKRVRLTVRAHSGVPEPGSWVSVLAILRPPPSPSLPGDYDFGRWAFYQQIGAVGYLYGRPRAIPEVRAPRWDERLLAGLQRLRGTMTARVRDVIPGREGVIAAALITGQRVDIDQGDQTAFRDSGLMHVLSISGLHLALAGGFFFWTIRALLALFPSIVLAYPIKKWAAVGALAGSTFYLLISGCEAPAVRSWIMLAMMFVAVLVDRPALSMRSVALAAAVIILATPESVLDPGSQMSFAAVIGLIALAEWSSAHRKAGEGKKTLIKRAWHYLAGIMVTSVIAGLATAPIAIFHFDRASPFGIIANLAALPVVGVIIMPAAVAAMVLMPFGLDYWPLVAMGWGVTAMLDIAHWVADLPGAGTVVPAWPGWCVALVMFGGLWISFWRRNWRWLGLAPIAIGIGFSFAVIPPDILVARDIRTVGVRLDGGKLALVRRITDDYAASNWLRRAGDERLPRDAIGGPPGLRCDAFGCLAHVHGALVAVDERADAFEEDCANAAVVISVVPAHALCRGPKLVIDGRDALRDGGYAIWLGTVPRVQTVEGERGRRPWSAAISRFPQ